MSSETTACPKTTVPIFHYDAKDYKFITDEAAPLSKFDIALKEKWENAEKKQIFRYKLNISEWKILEGKYKLLAQLNIDRGINRRPPESTFSFNQPYNPNKFNFNKITKEEIYFDIEDETGNNIIALNISPIEWGHCLFVPERYSNLPQKITEHSLFRAVELLLISSSPNLRVIFNGMCAFASVNHLHWHLYYLKHRLLLETIQLRKFVDPFCTLEDFPSKGFCIKLSLIPERDINRMVKLTFAVVQYLQNNDVAHNVYITRAKCESTSIPFDDVRIYIWARKPILGCKNIVEFTPAVSELFGHLIIKSREMYENLSEEMIANILDSQTSEVFLSVKEAIRLLLKQN